MATSLSPTPATQSFPPVEVDAPTFHRAITEAREHGKEEEIRSGVFKTLNSKWFGSCVHVYPREEYEGMQRVLFDEGRAGFALKDRDIVSVFRHPECNIKPALDTVIPAAVRLGGNRLDCFDRGLPGLYAKFGFIPVAKVEFEDQFAPEDWNFARDLRPNIIYMVYKREIGFKPSESDRDLRTRISLAISQLDYSIYDDALAIQRSLV